MSIFETPNPRKTPYVPGVVRGVVTRTGDLGQCWVKIARLHGVSVEVGGESGIETPAGVDVARDDRVLLAAVEGRHGDYIVVAKLR